MYIKRFILFLLLVPVLLGAQVTATKIFIDNKYPGIQYRPSGFDQSKKYPVVFFFHGQSEMGTGTDASLTKLLSNGNHANLLLNAEKYKFIVIAPQLVQSLNNWTPGWSSNGATVYIRRYFDYAMTLNIDTNRIYATGLSLGGGGVWSMMCDPYMSKKLSAAIPVCGTPQYENDYKIPAQNGVAVWAFHAKDDQTVAVIHSQNQVNFVNNSNPVISAKLTIYPTGGHGIWGTVYSTDSVYKWMLNYSRAPLPPVIIPPARKILKIYKIIIYDNGDIETTTEGISSTSPARIGINSLMVYDITQAKKRPENLFDGDTTTPAITDYFNGYILNETKGQVAWVVLDSFITSPKIEIFNGQYASGGIVDFQFFNDWTDTTKHSPVYSTTLPSNQWKIIDTKYPGSARLIKIRIADGASNNFTEVKITATTTGPASTILPATVNGPTDEGKYFMGYGKVFNDTLMDDAGYSVRLQNDNDLVNNTDDITGKNLTLTRYGNSVELTYKPAVRNGRKIFPYFSGPRKGFKIPPNFNNDTKDIPLGADSTDLNSWITTYHTYYALVSKLGRNKNASLAGYTIANTTAGSGLGMIEEIEIGNEDDARWVGPMRFHNPLVKLIKLKQGYAGAKAADPSIKIISGALTGLDTSYLKAMYLANLFRFKTKEVPFDIIAVNEYATNAGGQHAGTSDGISPEIFRLYEKIKGFLSVRDRLYPGMPVYLTEFGYDIHDGSNYDVPVIAGQSREQTKAYWYMRGMEAAAAAKVSKFFQYTQRNIPGGDFSTTGFSYDTLLTRPGKEVLPSYMQQVLPKHIWDNGGWCSLPKDLYWYMTCRAKVLENYKAWPELIRNGDSTGIWIARYTHVSNSKLVVYSIWMGTDRNLSVTNQSISIPGAISATLLTPAVGVKQGTSTALTVSNSTVWMPVNECVKYILVTLA
jgi:hypothetical protein